MVDGSYFEMQLERGNFDPWAVLSLHADDHQLTVRGIWLHVRRMVHRHVFQRATPVGGTHGPNVPTWTHVNMTKDRLDTNLEAARRRWAGLTVQVWNPYEDVRSPQALLPLSHRRSEFHP